MKRRLPQNSEYVKHRRVTRTQQVNSVQLARNPNSQEKELLKQYERFVKEECQGQSQLNDENAGTGTKIWKQRPGEKEKSSNPTRVRGQERPTKTRNRKCGLQRRGPKFCADQRQRDRARANSLRGRQTVHNESFEQGQIQEGMQEGNDELGQIQVEILEVIQEGMQEGNVEQEEILEESVEHNSRARVDAKARQEALDQTKFIDGIFYQFKIIRDENNLAETYAQYNNEDLSLTNSY